MGEAKRRGTREERIAQSIERQKAEDAERERQRAARIAAQREEFAKMPPEERQRLLMSRAYASSLRRKP